MSVVKSQVLPTLRKWWWVGAGFCVLLIAAVVPRKKRDDEIDSVDNMMDEIEQRTAEAKTEATLRKVLIQEEAADELKKLEEVKAEPDAKVRRAKLAAMLTSWGS